MSLAGRLNRGLAVITCTIALGLAVAGCQHNAAVTTSAGIPAQVAPSPATNSPMQRDTATNSGGASYSVGDPAAQGLTKGSGYGASNSSGTVVGSTGVTSSGGGNPGPGTGAASGSGSADRGGAGSTQPGSSTGAYGGYTDGQVTGTQPGATPPH